ncbi:phospholipase-like protein [Tanacetum coccineum]
MSEPAIFLNPLYLHPSDGLSSLTIQEKLTGTQNYRAWCKVIKIGLSTKRKLGFIKGTVIRSAIDANLVELWDTVYASHRRTLLVITRDLNYALDLDDLLVVSWMISGPMSWLSPTSAQQTSDRHLRPLSASNGATLMLPYDCRLTILSKLKMIPKIKEWISSSKKRLDLFKNNVFGKWLDLDDTNYDNHLLNYVLHHQRHGLSKSVDSDILFDIVGRTLMLGRVEFFLVTCFTCGKVVFPKYLDDGIPPFVRRMFSDKLKKLEKNKAALDEAAKRKAAQPSDKSDKDIVTIGHLGELVPDKAAKGKAAQPSDKGEKVSVMIRDLGELVQKDAKWKKLSFDDSDSNPTTMLQSTDAKMGQNWYRKSYDYLNDGCSATDGAKVSGEAMNDADMSAETKSAREIVLENKVEFLEARVEKLQLDHYQMAEFFENLD